MAKPSTSANKTSIKHVVKLTNQGGRRAKTSTMSKSTRRSFKKNQGQGR